MPVLAAFLRRAALEGASSRAGSLAQIFTFATGAVAFVFLARLVEAVPNPHLKGGGGYLGFLLIGLIGADLQRASMDSLPSRLREA